MSSTLYVRIQITRSCSWWLVVYLMLSLTWLGLVVAVVVMCNVTKKRHKMGSTMFYGMLMVSAVVALLLFTGQYNKFHSWVVRPLLMGSSAESANLRFGIMFDAGSTGSRIHAFKFRLISEDKPLVFQDEYFEHLKPGLSSYASDPEAAAKSLVPMLENAKLYIPASQWSETPIALKATAGLRLLPGNQADAILKEVRKLFETYPFKVTDESVSIMEGRDEGLYSWFTVNYYSGALEEPTSSYPVMDLGGGSTQITFVPSDPGTLADSPEDYITKMKVFDDRQKVYTHSYLGLGLMSGRFQTIGGKEGSTESNPSTFSSVCFPSGYDTKWVHGGKEYTIKGADTTGSRSAACEAAAKPLLSNIDKPAEIKYRDFTVISYYFDRAEQAGLVKTVEGGSVSVQDYAKAATKACEETNLNKDNEFLCIDLCYITSLLRDGFGFSLDTNLQVKKRINGHEISWALGAMFQMMPGGQAAKHTPGRIAEKSKLLWYEGQKDETLPTTLVTGHSFIWYIQKHLKSKHPFTSHSKALKVSDVTDVEMIGYPGEVTDGFLVNRMKTLPRADIVVLDIGCNDLDSRANYSNPKIAAMNVGKIIQKFILEHHVKHVKVCKAIPQNRRHSRHVHWEKINENIKIFNVELDKVVANITNASVHEHSEIFELPRSQWYSDGLHPGGFGMIRYTQSIKRAIKEALACAKL